MRVLTAGLLAAAAFPAVAAAAPHKSTHRRVEKKVASASADAKQVTESFVKLRFPLPAEAGARPEACNWVTYLRFRDAAGPRKSRNADAIFVTMPGIFAGAGSLDIFARNVVRTAHAAGRHVEVWTIDRRSNCLEDHYGVDQGKKRHDYRLAMKYYYHGAAINGRKFAGFKSEQDADFLKAVGLEQTVRDEYTLIRRTIPRKQRRKKVFCGGHSLGGPLTAAFAGWDFDRNPKTTKDAGYNQCAAFFALDTRLDGSTSGGGSGGGSSSVGLAAVFAQASGGSPYVNAPPFTPETIQAVPLAALGAFQEPTAESDYVKLLPEDQNFEASFRTLFSRNAENAVTQMPSIRDFRTTNEVALAAIFDDNSAPVTILRASLGTFDGGAVAQKEWPAPYNGELASGLIDGKHLMIPITPHGPLYKWRGYTKMNEPGAPVQKDDSGQRFTTAASEVTAIHQFARSVFESPADFAEQYFPLRLVADQEDAANGDRSGSLQDYRYVGTPKRPDFFADAQHGIEDGADPPPKGKGNRNMWIKLPGYDHIDVATAALHQNTGKHEAESAGLWKFARSVLSAK
ncbi:MAG: hypothetical protein QOH38_633 [Thermoleophilaceae bacterium]|nr:hypothetical protein [Thermoleophilaceae bacterium]